MNGDADIIAPILRLDNVSKAYGRTIALADVSLEIDAAQTVGIIGPNGAGKSTLLSIIAGQQRPDGGSVWLNGRRLDDKSPHEAARHGVVLAHQIPRPFIRMTVRQNLRVASLAGRRREHVAQRHDTVDRVLLECGLADKADRVSGDLTLLDQKRLGLARAMVVRPSLLLLDEVAAGLTLAEIRQLILLVERVKEAGVAIAIVEHVDNVIRELAARVIVLDWGRVVVQGTPQEIAVNEQVREIYLGKQRHITSGVKPSEQRAARAGKPLLEFVGVSARYSGPPALRNVDFAVYAGEIVAVLGANGAGKSTLAKAISGVLKPIAGQVLFDQSDITAVPAHARAQRGIAASPEGRRIFPDLSVEENLAIGAYPKHARATATQTKEWVYDVFPILRQRAQRFGNELSGGQQQMLAIGRALMAAPKLLILDEATLGLAPVAIDMIYDALERIRERNVTVVLIEQAAYRALAVADHVYVLDHGISTFAGSPSDLHNQDLLHRAYFGVA